MIRYVVIMKGKTFVNYYIKYLMVQIFTARKTKLMMTHF